MSKNRSLGHHEELRYTYLMKNFNYLNDDEKREFQYLYQKKKQAISRNTKKKSVRTEVIEEEQDFKKEEIVPGLLKYPEEPKRRKPKSSSHIKSKKEQASKMIPIKKAKRRKKRFSWKTLLKIASLLIVLVFLGMIFMFFKGVSDVSNGNTNYSPAVKEVFNGKKSKNGTNILILGSDKRISEASSDARTDTIMVANMGNSDGKIKLVSFMRDTLVNIKGVSEAGQYDQKLNVSFNIGEQDNHQGAELVRETLKRNYDIDIQYYVMVDFETFAEAVDTLFPNGVLIDAKFSTVDGKEVSSVKVPDDLRMENGIVPNQTIKVGKQKMDGRTLLNYARFRKDDEGDYGRTKRQQQVLKAVLSQIKDPTKLFSGSAAIGKIYALTSTNISYPILAKDGLKALLSGSKGVEQVTIPSNGDWVDEYDMYGGLGIAIDFDKYQTKLKELGLR